MLFASPAGSARLHRSPGVVRPVRIRKAASKRGSYETVFGLDDEAERLRAALYQVCQRGTPRFQERHQGFEASAKVFWDTYGKLSSQERERFEGYMAEIFSRLGMDLDNEPCRRTPHRWVQALVDMTDGYNGDPNIEVVFKRECVNCAQDIPTVQIVEGPIEFASLCEHHVLPFIGQAYIGCLRHEKIMGLSKFTRIVRKYARRFSVAGTYSPRGCERTGAYSG